MNFFGKPALTLTHILEPQETASDICLQHASSLGVGHPVAVDGLSSCFSLQEEQDPSDGGGGPAAVVTEG